jgi:hypothetical protein
MCEGVTPQRDDLADIVWLQRAYLGQKWISGRGARKEEPVAAVLHIASTA